MNDFVEIMGLCPALVHTEVLCVATQSEVSLLHTCLCDVVPSLVSVCAEVIRHNGSTCVSTINCISNEKVSSERVCNSVFCIISAFVLVIVPLHKFL